MDILAEICEVKRLHVAAQKKKVPQEKLEALIKKQERPREFLRRIQEQVEQEKIALIAEIKKASPSAGIIRKDFSPPLLAKAYEEGGATCLSVLTDVPYFQGNDAYIGQAKAASGLPVLRKDFILEPYQVFESRALGADCILLIMAMLEDNQAARLEALALDLGMDVLVEVHDKEELTRARRLYSKFIGINNRNLKTFKVDVATTEALAPALIKAGYTVVGESGIGDFRDIKRLQNIGVYSFLVGEALMRKGDVREATRELVGVNSLIWG